MTIKAERKEETIVFISLDLDAADWFTLPPRNGEAMTIERLLWAVSDVAAGRPLVAAATDGNGVGWTISLDMVDIPEHIRDALYAATEEGDLE